MAIDVRLNIERKFRVRASPARAFDVLADVPYSVSHFPDVESLEDQGDGVYRWVMEEKGTAGISHRVIYACRYTSDADKFTVTWTPVDGVGNSAIAGAWAIRAHDQGSHIDFLTTARLSMDFPRIFAAIAVPFARSMFETQINSYLNNLQVTLNS